MPHPPNALDFMLNAKLIFLLSLSILALLIPAPMVFSQTNAEKGQPPEVLIIYSTGTPFEWEVVMKKASKRSTREIEEIDAITTPTPSVQNCTTIAQKLAAVLRERHFTVRIAETGEIEHRNEILGARLLVIGSPAYFGNVSWKMKKLFDEQFHKIYMLEKNRLAKKRVAAFSMAEVDGSANGTLRAIKAVVGDCRGRFGPTMIFLLKHSKKEIQKRINQFAEQLAHLARD
jgi:flavodoxin